MRNFFAHFIASFLILVLSQSLFAQWSTSALTQNALYVCPGFSPNIITFSDGSSLISGTLSDHIYVQKLDERGFPLWFQPTLAHYDERTDSYGGTRLIHDGTGGSILVWGDHRGATPGPNGYYNNALYIQRVDGRGVVRWQQGGIQLATAYTGGKGAEIVSDGYGGAIFIVLEGDWDHPGATNIERLWGARYDSTGTMLWRRMYDSSTVQNSILLRNVVRLGSRVFAQTYGGTLTIDLNGDRLDIPLPLESSIVVDRDSTLFSSTFLSQRDTINDSIYINLHVTKYGVDLDTVWTTQLRALLDGEFETGIQMPFIPDERGGLYYVRSSYDDIQSVRTRVYHLDSIGSSLWPVGQAFLPSLPTWDAFNDGSGGIVILLAFTYNRAARFDYQGNPLWPAQPITTISDPENLGPIRSGGDNKGGAIIPFWSLSGGIRVQHTGRNGAVGIITGVNPESMEPLSFELYQNYPNPFNPSTTIRFALAVRELVELDVFDVLGRKVTSLAHEMKEPGTHTVSWNAGGSASGVYYYRLKTGNGRALVRQMILLR